jgi:hypothetical protein
LQTVAVGCLFSVATVRDIAPSEMGRTAEAETNRAERDARKARAKRAEEAMASEDTDGRGEWAGPRVR